MTSKISFSNISKDYMKRGLSVIICTIFIFAVSLLIFAIGVQNALYEASNGFDVQVLLERVVNPDFSMMPMTVAISVALAFWSFSYLHNRSQVDLFGSLPVKRETMFWVNVKNSLVIFVVPLFVFEVIKIVTIGVLGYLSRNVVVSVAEDFVFSILAMLAVWVTTSLAIIMTGQLMVAVAGTMVYFTICPLFYGYLIQTFATTFFPSYNGLGERNIGFYFSPIYLAEGMINETSPTYIIGSILWIFVIGALCFWLLKKRPAEAAGRAMAFEKVNVVIKLAMIIPMSLYVGIFLYEVVMSSSKIWLYIGLIFGVIICHSLVEMIFQSDVRAIFTKKLHLLATMVICLGFVAVFQFDLIGFEKWVPNRNQVEMVDLKMDALQMTRERYWGEKPEKFEKEDIDKVLDMLEVATVSAKEVQENDGALSGMTERIEVVYHLKNGKEKSRQYLVDSERIAETLDKVFVSKAFKESQYGLYTADLSKIKKIEINNSAKYETLNLNKDELEEFVQIYLEELTACKYSEMTRKAPLYEFTVSHAKTFCYYLNGYSDIDDDYFIYPSFKKTLAFLEEHGFLMEQITDYDITKVVINKYEEASEENTENEITITDRALIEKYKDTFQNNEYATGFSLPYSNKYDMYIVYRVDGTENTCYVTAPDEVIEAMLK